MSRPPWSVVNVVKRSITVRAASWTRPQRVYLPTSHPRRGGDFISSVCFELGREGRLRRIGEEANNGLEVVKGEI
jgi:hypothetical protein